MMFVKCLTYSIEQVLTKVTLQPAGLPRLLHVDKRHLGQREAAVALAHCGQAVLSGQGVMVAFHARRRAPQHRARTPHPGQIDGRVAPLVAWCRVVLFVGCIVLFVDDDETQVVEWEEKCAAGSEKNLITSRVVFVFQRSALPHFNSLARRKTGVVDPDFLAEIALQSVDDLRRQRNLRQKHQHLMSCFNLFVYQLDIHLSLTARRHAVQQAYIRRCRARQYAPRRFLLLVQHNGRGWLHMAVDIDQSAFNPLFGHQHTVLQQCLQSRALRQHPFGHQLLAEMRQLHHLHQQLDLLCTPLAFQFVEEGFQRSLAGIVVGETKPDAFARHKTLTQFLFHEHNTALDHSPHERHNLLYAKGSAYVFNTHHGVLAQQVDDHALVFGEAAEFAVEIRVDAEGAFTCQLEACRQSHLHHVARVAHIIARHPLPEFHLPLAHKRFRVEHAEDVFGPPLRCHVVHTPHHRGIHPARLLTELNNHTHARQDLPVQLTRHSISIGVRQMQRQQHIDIICFEVVHFEVQRYTFFFNQPAKWYAGVTSRKKWYAGVPPAKKKRQSSKVTELKSHSDTQPLSHSAAQKVK